MKVAILGAGAGGTSAAVDLSKRGHHVRLWNRSPETIEPLRAAGGIAYQGVFGEGFIPIADITTDLGVVQDSDVLLVCLPTLALGALATDLVRAGLDRKPVILNPGHTGGALEFAHVVRRAGHAPPPTVEFSTLTYVARKERPDLVVTTGQARAVRAAPLPGGNGALSLARKLYDSAKPASSVLETSLCNVNMVLHPPGAILGAAWIEATNGNYTFYVEGLTAGVERTMEQLDHERRAVARAFGLDLPPLFEEMQAIGTIEPNADTRRGLAAAIRGGTANRNIRAPDTLRHRYFHEDLWYGLKPFLAFAEIAGVETPIARALWTLGVTLVGAESPASGRSAREMGIAGSSVPELLRMVTERQ